MTHVRKKGRVRCFGIAVLVLTLLVAALAAPLSAETVTLNEEIAGRITEYRRFVEYRYGLEIPSELTVEFLSLPLSDRADELTAWSEAKGASASYGAVELAVEAAGLSELAATYSDEKVKASLTAAGQNGVETVEDRHRALAVAFDLELIPAGLAADVDLDGAVSADLTALLTGRILEFNGLYKRALGKIGDADIYAKVINEWNTQLLLEAEKLREIVNTLLEDDVITGYNLKDLSYEPRFDPELTITYGHSDIRHAIQLIGLIRSEGLDARVQLEPKTSAYIHLKAWGEPEISREFQVEQIENGNFIAYAREYDLSFEFFSREDKEAFQPIVFAYAKRNQEDMTGLIAGSWWQPLYYSLTPIDDYIAITNNYFQDGVVQVQTFSRNEDSGAVVEAMKALTGEYEVQTYEFWVDEPFFQYLLGEAN